MNSKGRRNGIEYLDPDAINGLNLYAYCNNNPAIYLDSNGTDAILITAYGQNGLPIVGHSALAIYGTRNINGEAKTGWWLTEFTGKNKADARVRFVYMDVKPNESVYDKIYNRYNGYGILGEAGILLGGFFYTTQYLEGDYSASLEKAAEIYFNENNVNHYNGQYNLFTNNCLDYVQEVLSASSINDSLAQVYHNNSITIVPSAFSIATAIALGVQSVKEFVSNAVNSITAWWNGLW